MPKRNYASGEQNFNAFHARDEKSKQPNRASKKLGRYGLMMTGLIAAGIYTAGLANADTNVYVGGNGDTNAQGVVDQVTANGDFNPNANNIQVNYSASIAPLGPVPMDQSVAEGAQNTFDAVVANMGDPNITVEGFSLGAIVVDKTGHMLADKYGAVPGNVHLVTDGNADGDTGLFNNQQVMGIAQPFMAPFGIDTSNTPEPGTRNRNDAHDVWGGSANEDLGGVINDAVNMQSHRIPAESEPHTTYVDANGVTNEVYGDAPNFVPPAPDAAPVEAPASEPVRNTTPEFFGEQACVAPDGSQYFTPGDAPC